jgi:hypothetical protein
MRILLYQAQLMIYRKNFIVLSDKYYYNHIYHILASFFEFFCFLNEIIDPR